MISQISLEFTQADLIAASSLFFLNMSTIIGISNLEVTYSISPYVVNFDIQYLIVIFDLPSIQTDYPQFLFKTNKWVNTATVFNRAIPFDCFD